MPKGYIIIGKAESGKTYQANKIHERYKSVIHHEVTRRGENIWDVLDHRITGQTDLVHVGGVRSIDQLSEFIPLMSDGNDHLRQGRTFDIVIECAEWMTMSSIGPSLRTRFTIIECFKNRGNYHAIERRETLPNTKIPML